MPAAGSTVPARTLMFNYDENNSPVGFQFKSDVSNYWYFYVFAKNAQGDITSIYRRDVDANGKKYLSHIADYEYDPWGRVLSVKDSTGRDISNESNNSAAINPFRYRGYYYDSESGFYYLQSRYYDPVIKRFLNADSFASTGQGYLGYNMYAYCCNNPICREDRTGHEGASIWGALMWWLTLIDGPLPFGDYIYGAGIAAFGSAEIGAIYYMITANNTGTYSALDEAYAISPAESYILPTDPMESYVEITTATVNSSKARGKEHIRDSGLVGLSDAEVSAKARDKSLSPKERKRYQQEEKARGLRNVQKRRELYCRKSAVSEVE